MYTRNKIAAAREDKLSVGGLTRPRSERRVLRKRRRIGRGKEEVHGLVRSIRVELDRAELDRELEE